MALASRLPSELLDRFVRDGFVARGQSSANLLETADRARADFEFQRSARRLPLGVAELDRLLPGHGLQFGDVVELQVHGASGAATSFALAACRAGQNLSSAGTSTPLRRWCAFVDPSGTLFAPGAAQLGVDLERLLVVRPDLGSIDRVAVRIAEAKLVSVLVIDLRGALGDVAFDAHKWQRTVRKLSLIIKQLSTCVLLLTDARGARSLPLPVALRLELTRPSREAFELRVGKERSGRITAPRTISWSALTPVPFTGAAQSHVSTGHASGVPA